MPKKKRRKRVRRRAPSLSKRIAQLGFLASDRPDSVAGAIACLGPLPTPTVGNSREAYPFDFEFAHVDRIKNAKMARALCESIAERYALNLQLQRTYISPADALNSLAAAKDAVVSCAAALANLGPQERMMLHVFQDIPRGPQLDLLGDLYEKIPAEELPEVFFLKDGKMEQGSLADSLQDLSAYLEALISVRAAQMRQKRSGQDGLKIRRTAAGFFAAAPEWTLIDECWRLFDRLNLRPSSTVGGPVQSFARHLHRWVVGREDSLDSYFKKYATCRLKLNKLRAEFAALAHSLNKSRRELEVDCQHDQRKEVSELMFLKARSLWSKIQDLEDTVYYGS